MSLFFRSRTEQRAITGGDAVWGTGSAEPLLRSGAEGTYGRLVALFAAHRFIIDQFAAVPLHAYRRRPDGTRQRLAVQPRLFTSPAPGRTPSGWRAQMIASLLGHGNAYGLITDLDAGGWPAQIVWLNPNDVHVDEGPLPTYYLHGREIDRAEILHIPWIVQPGKWKGLSPLGAFRTVWETGAAAQVSARDWHLGGSVPSGHLKSSGVITEEADVQRVKARFKAAVRGRDVFVSGNDWDYSQIGVSAADAQIIETLKLTATQIANIYGLPPEKIGGERGGSMTYSTVVMDQLAVQVEVLAPWCARVEDALTAVMPQPQYAAFNLDAQLRADPLARAQALEAQQRAGTLTNDEARNLEDRAPLTPEERVAWLQAFRGQTTNDASLAETIQKIYLGVGKVITTDEAREIVNSLGGNLVVPAPESLSNPSPAQTGAQP